MVFLIILSAIICLCVGFVAGLILAVFMMDEKISPPKVKRQIKPTYEKELKNFFSYDGTNQDV